MELDEETAIKPETSGWINWITCILCVYIVIYIYVYVYIIFYICKYVTNLKQTICLIKEEHTPSPGAKSALTYLKQADIA